jgi:ferredoxin-NADP reductase
MEFETRVDGILRRAHDVKSFRFRRPQGFDFDPGQFLFITILIGGEKKRKHFTISSSPTEKSFIEFTKKIMEDHEFSTALNELQIGDWAYIDGPYGEFTFKGEFSTIGMITGGIGITPLRSMIKYCTDNALNSQITLLYGNRSEENITFGEELSNLEKRNKNLRIVHTLSHPSDKWNGRRGHVDLQMIKDEIPNYLERVFYVCGPPALVNDLVNALKTLGVPDGKIKTENFFGY